MLKEQAEEYFADFISRCIRLSPTKELTKMATGYQIAASDLKKGSSGHFAEFTPMDTHKQWLKVPVRGRVPISADRCESQLVRIP